MTSPLQTTYDQITTDPRLSGRLMAGDSTIVRLFNDTAARLHGIEPEPGGPDAADVLTSDDPAAGASHDLFAPDARERLPDASAIGGPSAMSDRQKIDLINDLRSRGTPEPTIREALDPDRTYTAELRAWADQTWRDLTSDPAFVRGLFSGDSVAERKWRAYSVIAAGGIKG